MLIALFQPDIAQNVGSMIRLSACLGLPLHLIEPCGFPLDDRRMRRATMDYYAQATVVRHASWQAFLDARQTRHPGRLVLLTTRSTQSYTQFAFRKGDILLLGQESAGVPDAVRAAADACVTVPLAASARSLNLVQAACMVAGEALRQTDMFPSRG